MSKRICVIGAGRWGKNHIKTLNELGSLGGIVETREAARTELAKQYPAATVHADYREAAGAAYDGFVVATPAETHFQIAEYLLSLKKPVLVEKPITLASSEARRLRALAEKEHVPLMVGHVLLFHPAIRKIKELIVGGKLGKIEYLYSNRLNLGTVRTEENILWSFAPHDISIFQYLIGDRPVEVISRGGAFIQPAIHDSTMTILRYPDNIVGHIFVSWLHPFKEHRLVVIGSKGMISYEDASDSREILFYEKGIDWVKGEPIKREGPTEKIPFGQAAPLAEELKAFIAAIDGRPVDAADGRNAEEVLDILEQASESLISGKEVLPPKKDPPAVKKEYFIHPSAVVDEDVDLGAGTKVWHFSHIQSGSRIGRNVSIGQNVNVGNHVRIGNGVKIQNNVSVYEGVELEDFVFCGPSMVFTNIKQPRSEFPQRGTQFYYKTLVKKSASLGANSTIVCGSTVGQYAFVGAGAVVTKDVPDFALVVGNPARFLSWVCKCGHKIEFDKAKKSVCGNCGREFQKSGETVTCVKDKPEAK
jgi:UDP-2-acetamido-3-amino-2,3-dideoxy-glucuronate N-acetyltransferase